MADKGPLAGLRVVDLTGDLGRFGTRLLAEFGAAVVRPVGWGSRGREVAGLAPSGLLDLWFDGTKIDVRLDLDTDNGQAEYRELALGADLIVEALPVGYLAERGLDHQDLLADHPTLTQVSLTPFGRTGPRSTWQSSDLVAGALSGVMSITGTESEPLNTWGGQNHNFGGFAAALCGLAGVSAARRDGRGQLIDLSLHEVLTGSIENLFVQYFYDDLLDHPKVAARQGSLHWLGLYEVVPAKRGHVMITPTPQPERLIDWMVERGIDEAEPFVGLTIEELLGRVPELMAAIKVFCSTMDAGELFVEAQRRHIAFGEVQSVEQIATNPQFIFRRFFTDKPVVSDEGGRGTGQPAVVRGPWRLARFSDTPIDHAAPKPEAESVVQVARRWAGAGRAASDSPTDGSTDGPSNGLGQGPPAAGPDLAPLPPARPLDGLTVLDLSWVLAGPFATRLLGDLGADVIKLQTEERATMVNRPDYPYYPVWNRSKRSVTVDLKHPDAQSVIRPLVERADVLVENYSAGVLDRLGLGWDQVKGWNDRLVYVSMSGCGHDGPWKDVISYAPTVHALCGLTRLTNPAGRGDVGSGFSLNDHAAGFASAISVLAALEARRRTGRGQRIDLAQLEVGAFLIGPALIDHFATGRVAEAAGNRDALSDLVPNDVYRCGDGRFLAVTAADDDMWNRLAGVLGLGSAEVERLATVEARRSDRAGVDRLLAAWAAGVEAEAAMVALQQHGVAAGVVQDAEDLAERDPQLAARSFWLTADLPQFGPRRHDRFPAHWSDSTLGPYRPPPAFLGEANFDVLSELAGLTADQIGLGMAEGLFS